MSTFTHYLLEHDNVACCIVVAVRNSRNAAILEARNRYLVPPVPDDHIKVYDAADRIRQIQSVIEITRVIDDLLKRENYNLDDEWELTAACVALKGDDDGLADVLYNAAERIRHLRIRDEIRSVFNNEITRETRAISEFYDPTDRIARLEILREYVCNEVFRQSLHDLVWQLTQAHKA